MTQDTAGARCAPHRYPDRVRQAALDQCAQTGAQVAAIARRHGVSPTTVYRWQRQARRAAQAIQLCSGGLPAVRQQLRDAAVRMWKQHFADDLLRSDISQHDGTQ